MIRPVNALSEQTSVPKIGFHARGLKTTALLGFSDLQTRTKHRNSSPRLIAGCQSYPLGSRHTDDSAF